MSTKIQIIFYSMYGHVYKMAEAVAEGARSVADVDVEIYRVTETIPDSVIESHGAKAAQDVFKHIPIAEIDKLPEADAIIFGSPTRFGNMAGQMKNFIDQLGGLWAKGALNGKVGSVFSSTATQHGGQETTIMSFITVLMHLGFIVVGVPYSEQRLMNMDEITGGTPYGATTLAATDGSRLPSDNELAIARFQGKYVAETAKKLKG